MNGQPAALSRWKQRFSGSLNRRIFSAAMLVAALTFATKLIAMVKDVFSAAAFGTGDAMDAFLVAFVVPSFAINVLAGQMNAAFIPVFIEVRDRQGAAAGQRLFSGALIFSIAVLAAATLLLVLTAPLFMPLLCAGFSPEKSALTLRLFHLLLPVIVLTGLVMNCEAALNAGEKFAIGHVASAVVPLATMLLVWGFAGTLGIDTLVIGLVGGTVAQLVIVALGLARRGLRFTPRWPGCDENMRRLIGQYLPAVAASATMCSTQLVDQSMAGMLAAGSVSSLNYGNKIPAFALTIGAMGLGTAVLPYFSQMAAGKRWGEMRHTLWTYVRLIFAFTVPMALIGILLSRPATALLYERGNFTSSDTDVVSRVQSMFLLQLPFYTLTILFVRMISSLQANNVLMWGTVISFVLNITLNYVFMQSMGVAGIALSTSIVYAVLSGFHATVLSRRLRSLSGEAAA